MLHTRRHKIISCSNTSALTPVAGGGGGWVPSTPSTTLSYWYDPTDISTLFKDTAGTVPVTADGDIVLRMNDKSGNGLPLVQVEGTTYGPIYRTGSGKPYLEYSSNRFFNTQSACQVVNPTNGSLSLGIAFVTTTPVGSSQFLMSQDQVGTPVFQFWIDGSDGTIVEWHRDASGSLIAGDNAGTATANTNYYITSTLDAAGTCEMWKNGVSNGSTGLFGTGPLTTGTLSLGIGAKPGGGNPLSGKLYCAVAYQGALNSTDRANLDTYLSGKF